MAGLILSRWPRSARRRWGERRAAVRFSPPQEVSCYCGLTPDGDFVTARVCDISASGACLVVNQAVGLGKVLSVELVNEMHTYLCTRSLHVTRTFHGANGECVFAGEFDQRLQYEELLPFLV